MALHCDHSFDFEELANNLDYASFDPLMDTTVLDSISMAL
jgi:hypothetical protein